MKDDQLLTILEETAEKLGVEMAYDEVRKGEVSSYGDSYILRGQNHILIDKRLDTSERAGLLLEILSSFDSSAIHLPPEIRERLDQAKNDRVAKEQAASKAEEEAAKNRIEEPAADDEPADAEEVTEEEQPEEEPKEN